MTWRDRYLCLRDATTQTIFDRHYIFHTGWAARILAATRPTEHVDISSSVYFVVIASAFVRVRFIDFRPAIFGLENLKSEAGDICALPLADGSVESLSCMHVLEHIGLGRYGDPLDYDGDLKAVAELKRVLAPGGQLMMVVPTGGVSRIQFNAHRIYTYRQLREMFSELELVEFSLIPDDGNPEGLIRNASEETANLQRYGCGCFLFRKP